MVKKVININLTLAFPPWNLALTLAGAILFALFLAAHALLVFRNKPISETEINREIDRQAGQRG